MMVTANPKLLLIGERATFRKVWRFLMPEDDPSYVTMHASRANPVRLRSNSQAALRLHSPSKPVVQERVRERPNSNVGFRIVLFLSILNIVLLLLHPRLRASLHVLKSGSRPATQEKQSMDYYFPPLDKVSRLLRSKERTLW